MVLDILGRRLLGFFILRGIEVAGDLEIYGLHMGVNCLHQLPHAGGIFLIRNVSLALNRRSNSRAWDLIRVPQWGILGHSQCQKGIQPPLFEPLDLGLVDNRFHRVISIRKAFIVSLVLTGLKGCLQIGHFINM